MTDIEVQLSPLNMIDRGFLYAGQLAAVNANCGGTMREVLKNMPRILTLTEVIKMNAALQEFLTSDSGFGQYAGRYEDVSGNLAVRRQFAVWTAEMDKLESAMARGKAEGEKERAIKDARNLLSLGVAPEIVAKGVELSISEVLELSR